MTQQTTAHKTVMALKEHTRKDLELKFRNVHALIKNNRPISDIAWLNQLDRTKGLGHSKTYDNMTAATCFMEFISLRGKNSLTFCLKLTFSPSPWTAVQMTVLLNRKLYLLETVFREKLSQDLCVLVNPNQPALKICLPL